MSVPRKKIIKLLIRAAEIVDESPLLIGCCEGILQACKEDTQVDNAALGGTYLKVFILEDHFFYAMSWHGMGYMMPLWKKNKEARILALLFAAEMVRTYDVELP